MKSSSRDGTDVRRVLIGMVTDQSVCSRVSSQWQAPGLFENRWANMIGQWCVDHMQRYDEPPGRHIQSIFDQWASTGNPNEKMVQSIERFLTHLSTEYERKQLSSEYLLSIAGRHFNRVLVRKELLIAEEELDAGDVDNAYGRLTSMSRVELGTGSMVKPASDFSAWRKAFDADRRKPLVAYPGAMHRFIDQYLTRGRLISFMGPDKSGKSFHMLDVAFRAIRAKSRVAYFEVGDLGEEDTLLRFGCRAARRPLVAGSIELPLSVDREYEVETEMQKFRKSLSPQVAFKSFRRYCQRRGDIFRLSCHANSSISIHGISSILSDWERDGWNADVVVIDYADILAPPSGIRDTLDQIDVTWKSMRRMSQERDCLLVTATQSSSLAYRPNNGLLTAAHFSGRKTKLAEVNGMIGINVTPENKEKGICELNWVVTRDANYTAHQSIVLAGQLGIASPSIRSCF